MPPDEFARFIAAQDDCLAAVEAELARGRKQTHWMWFVFPQIDGLGHSPAAKFYAIADLAQAQRYARHPMLGERLRRHVGLVMRHAGRSARDIFGAPDDLKFRSCLTLFAAAAESPQDAALFQHALRSFYDGQPDALTLRLLQPAGRAPN